MSTNYFPVSLTIDVPFPTPRLASAAVQALSVDPELSSLVERRFEIASNKSTLRTTYHAATNRMLRVAVNGFFESLRVVIQVMTDLDVGVIDTPVTESLDRVQGIIVQ